MWRVLLVAVLAAWSTVALAQGRVSVGGFVQLALSGLGGTTAVAGESRLPVRAADVAWEGGELRVRGAGQRGSVRELSIVVRNAEAGRRYEVGDPGEASLEVVFASGQALRPASGRGVVEIAEVDGRRAAGSFEATLTQGRIPLTLRGRFEVVLPGARNGE